MKQNGAALAMSNGANGDLSEGEEEPKQTFVDNAMQQIKPKIGSPNKESGNPGPVSSANINGYGTFDVLIAASLVLFLEKYTSDIFSSDLELQ